MWLPLSTDTSEKSSVRDVKTDLLLTGVAPHGAIPEWWRTLLGDLLGRSTRECDVEVVAPCAQRRARAGTLRLQPPGYAAQEGWLEKGGGRKKSAY